MDNTKSVKDRLLDEYTFKTEEKCCCVCGKTLKFKEMSMDICKKCLKRVNKEELWKDVRRAQSLVDGLVKDQKVLQYTITELMKERNRALKQRNTVSAEYKKLKEQLKELESRKDK